MSKVEAYRLEDVEDLMTFRPLALRSSIIILKSDNIVFPKIGPILHFNDMQGLLTEVFQSVTGFDRNFRAMTDVEIEHLTASGHSRGSGDHDPMFTPSMVHL